MQFDLFDVAKYDKLGALIRKWAEDKTSRPPNGPIAELKAVMNHPDCDVGVSFEGRKYTKFEIRDFPNTKNGDVLVILVPPIEIIRDAEKDLETNDYQTPTFYDDAFGVLPKIPKDKRKPFHAQRIAEYVMKWCG